MGRLKIFVLTTLVAAFTTSCGGAMQDMAIEQASREFDCPKDDVTAKWIDVQTYQMNACGNSVVYICSHQKDRCTNDTNAPF